MTRLAIKGHPTRGKEVIEILEMFGGYNDGSYRCDLTEYVYSINEQGIIDWYIPHPNSPLVIFTIEKFLEKFPYKVGDKVYNIIHNENQTITNLIWDPQENEIVYQTDSNDYVYVNYLQPHKEVLYGHKEETMEKVKDNWAKWDLPDGYEFQDEEGNVIKTGVIKLVKKQPQYPKTYKECCKVLMGKTDFQDYSLLLTKLSTKINEANSISPEPPHITLINNFYKLLICRDAYWKIAGKHMDLGKPWEPDYTDDNIKYIIGVHRNNLDFNCTIERNYILIFPSEEMRDEFYENFKDLIEACKEFL